MQKLEKIMIKSGSKRSVKAEAVSSESEDRLFIVKDSELRRLLRLSNVQAYYDCRVRPLPWTHTKLEERS